MARSPKAAVVGMCVLSGAVAFWLNAHAEAPVVDASRTPGLLELVASLAAVARPALPLAKVLAAWHQIAIVSAAGFTALAVFLLTRSVTAGAAIGLVAAASPLMLPALAPPDATALAVSAAAMSAIVGGSAFGASITLMIVAAVVPPLIVPNIALSGLLAFGSPQRRLLRVFAAAMLFVLVPAALVLALPAMPGEPFTAALRASLRWPADLRAAAQFIVAVLSSAGPLTLALAAFGAFAMAFGEIRAFLPAGAVRRTLAIGFPVAACVAACVPGVDRARVLAPLVVTLWLLAGAGIAELVSRSRDSRYRAGGLAIAVIFVAVDVTPRINPPPSAAEQRPRLGHESLTRQHFQELLYQIPTDAALVDDDAVTSVLLRSLGGSLERAHKSIRIVARTSDDVATAKNLSRVFAMPRAQTELQERGVRLVDDAAPPVPGLAEVAAVVPCDALTTTWRSIPSATGVTRLAFVAGNNEARGPIVVYTGGLAAIDTTAINWPALAMRGFYTRSYDRAQPERRQGLADEVANDGAPADAPAVNASNVARTELWRVPGAPQALMFALSSPSTAVVATQLARGTGPIQLCPVFPFPVRAFRR